MDALPPATATEAGYNLVHSPGIVRIAHAPKGSDVPWIFTGGDDYLVRLVPAAHNADLESRTISDATKPVTWVDADRNYLVTASEDGCVRIYQHSFPDGSQQDNSSPTDLVALLARSPLAARCAALEISVKAGKTPRVAVCTDDLTVKLIDAGDTTNTQLITGHTRSVRSASWCPTQPLLVTCSCDGTARVWDVSTHEIDELKVVEGVLASSRPESELACLAAWHPSGNYFVLPGKLNELVVISSPNWTRTATFSVASDSNVATPTGEISALAFCPNGRYLAAATKDCRITVYESASRRAIRSRTADALVTSLSWRPDADGLAWADVQGSLIRWDDVVGSTYPSPHEHIAFAPTSSSRRLQQDADDLFGDDDGEAGNVFLDDEAGDEEGGRRRRRRREEDEVDDNGDDMEGFVVDDEDGIYTTAGNQQQQRKKQRGAVKGRTPAGHLVAATRPQPTFQPTSTPMLAQRRYLCFNVLGALVAMDQDSHQTIAFESYDSTARRNWRFTDHHKHTMAALGGTGALFACPEQRAVDEDAEDQPSTVFFKPFEAAGAWSVPGAEWSAHLPKGETAIAVALSGRSDEAIAAYSVHAAVVATSAGYLRIFSASGLQRYVWALGESVVTMAAGARHLLVVHRGVTGGALDGHQNLSYTVMDLATFNVRQTGSLPLVRDATLLWAGFNDVDVPAIYDSRGVVMLLDRTFAGAGQARWVPILDTHLATARMRDEEGGDAVGSSITYWPVGLSSTKLMTLMLKGPRAHPDPSAASRPLIQEVSLSLPLLNVDNAAGRLEEEHVRSVLLADTARLVRRARIEDVGEEATAALEVAAEDEAGGDALAPHILDYAADKALLQLIQLACKSERHARVLDAARELHSSKTLDAALQIAAFFHLPSLAERMTNLSEWVSSRADRDANRGFGAVVEAPYSATGHSRILVASSQEPESMRGSVSGASAARKALTRDFGATSAAGGGGSRRTIRKSYGRGGIGGGEASGSLDWDETPSSPALERTGSDKENGRRDAGSASPEAGRRDDDADDGAESMGPPRTKSRPSNPFATTKPAGAKNPFARNPGMTRDRSMHKSTSFFERVDAVEGGGGAGAPQRKQAKQTTLFGFAGVADAAGGKKRKAGEGGSGANGANGKRQNSTSRSTDAILPHGTTPAFGEAENFETQEHEDEEEEEALRLTLSAAAAKGVPRLEETQYPEEAEQTQFEETPMQMEVEGDVGVSKGGAVEMDEDESLPPLSTLRQAAGRENWTESMPQPVPASY